MKQPKIRVDRSRVNFVKIPKILLSKSYLKTYNLISLVQVQSRKEYKTEKNFLALCCLSLRNAMCHISSGLLECCLLL